MLCPHAVQAIGLFRGQEGAAPGGGVGSGEGGGGDSAETGEGGSGSRGTLGQSLLNQMQERLGVQQRVTMVAPEDMATVCSNEGKRWLVALLAAATVCNQRLWLWQPVPGATDALACLL